MNHKCKQCIFFDICSHGLPYCNDQSFIPKDYKHIKLTK
jgi:hypothetical protein